MDEETRLLAADGLPTTSPQRGSVSFFKSLQSLRRFIGPGFLIGVGFLDPGNWASDLAAGSAYRHELLYVVVLSNFMAMVVQYLCIKLGVVADLDLAMACRKNLPSALNLFLYVLAEIAIIATDLAEVIGTAIALNLLCALPLPVGVAITSLDVLLILAFWESKNMKTFELCVIVLLGVVASCFIYLLAISQPHWRSIFAGLLPTEKIWSDSSMLYIAVSLIGASVMPHSLFLHSSIVRHRDWNGEVVEFDPDAHVDTSSETGDFLASKPPQPAAQKESIPSVLSHTNIDSIIALSCACLINCSILIVAATVQPLDGGEVSELKDAYFLLRDTLGPAAGVAFALALFLAGQSSTVTGTIAGQIVMEGFLSKEFRVAPWLRRLSTRLLAIIPAMIAAILTGNSGMNELLVGSQVVLSLQLPFAIWPLVFFTSSGKIMSLDFKESNGEISRKSYANSFILGTGAVVISIFITIVNVILIIQVIL